ncbi:MAG: GTP cyclohydrolase I FolE2, partial [Verrucomicrobia bacterium]|nr:GTP cyclohydrolase I FolE2 [Verrucomicrobiota bacterium]
MIFIPMKKPRSRQGKLHDTQSSPDFRNLRIDKVGVKGLRYPIVVRDRSRATQNTVATVALAVDLPHQFKGTHMSRFLEVLQDHGGLIHVQSIPKILRALQNKLHAESAHLELDFPYFIEKKAPVSGSPGLVDYQTRFDAVLHGDDLTFKVAVTVPVTTLCPCSKAISTRGAHNQRGYVRLEVTFRKPVWIEDLVSLVESCGSSEIYSLLKRP